MLLGRLVLRDSRLNFNRDQFILDVFIFGSRWQCMLGLLVLDLTVSIDRLIVSLNTIAINIDHNVSLARLTLA